MEIFVFSVVFLGIIIIVIRTCFVAYQNSNSYIRQNGRKTEGIITSVQSRSTKDRYGKVHVSYIVSYRFQDIEPKRKEIKQKQTWRGKFTIKSSTCRFKEEDTVTVYYLPDKPYKNVVSR